MARRLGGGSGVPGQAWEGDGEAGAPLNPYATGDRLLLPSRVREGQGVGLSCPKTQIPLSF